MKKWFAVLLAIVCLFGVLSIGNAEERVKVKTADGTEFYETGLPIVDPDQNVELTIWGVTSASDPNTFEMCKKYEEETGIHINWIGVSEDGLEERKNLMWASGDYPDILGPSIPNDSDINMYGPMGIIIPLNEYIDKYLNTFRANCGGEEVWNNVWGKLTYPDGNIYAFPTVMDYFNCDNTVPSINIDWLEKLGMKMPETPEEFVEYLRAVKTQDPNGNGKADEIPFVTQNWRGIFESYAVAGWTGELAGIKYIEDGKVVYPVSSDAVKEAARWLHQIYEEGLMDPEIYTQDENMMKGKAQGDELIYGFSTVWREGNVFGEKNSLSYFPMKPLQGKDGKRLWYGTKDRSLVSSQWCVTSACKYPEIAARFVDYLYDPLMSLQSDYGPVGIALEEQADGTYKQITPAGYSTIAEWFIDNHFQQMPRLEIGTFLTCNDGKGILYTDPEQLTWTQMTERYTAEIGGYQKNVQDMIVGEYVTTAFPGVKPTQEETDELQLLEGDFTKYVEESLTRFVTGEMSIDNDWDAYVQRVNELGYERLMAIYQQQYDRYASGLN